MNTFELLDELMKKPKEEINYALIELLLKDKIDFIQISNAYTSALNVIKEDRLNQLIEAETCVMLGIHRKFGGKKETDRTFTQRCLHLLNKSRRFQVKNLNDKVYSVTYSGGIVVGMRYGYNSDDYSGLFSFGDTEDDVRRKAMNIYMKKEIERLIQKRNKKFKKKIETL